MSIKRVKMKFLLSQGSFNQKNMFICQKVCCVSNVHTDNRGENRKHHCIIYTVSQFCWVKGGLRYRIDYQEEDISLKKLWPIQWILTWSIIIKSLQLVQRCMPGHISVKTKYGIGV